MGNILDIFTYSPESPMLFSSRDFLLLFLPFFAIFTVVSHKVTWRNLYLTLFSLFFYYKTGGIYFLLILLMSLTDYTISLFLTTTKEQKHRKWLVTTSVVFDLGVLCYFKYTGLLGEMLSALTDGNISFGDIFLPVGISFFTFQSLSYVIDVYRGDIEPAKSWSDYLFYLCFFLGGQGQNVSIDNFLFVINRIMLCHSNLSFLFLLVLVEVVQIY